MKVLGHYQGNVREFMYTSRELTEEEKELWKNGQFDLDCVPERYRVPNSVMLNDWGDCESFIPMGYENGGVLSQQRRVVKDNYYTGIVNGDSVLCLATVTKDWVLGTSLPDNTMEIINQEKYITLP